MNRSIRLMLTEDQEKLIHQAAALEGVDMTAWVRPLILEAARERIAKSEKGKKRLPS